jgi:hypothetical protein
VLEPVPDAAIEAELEPVADDSAELVEEPMQLVVPEPPPPSDSSELIDARDASLLPITNRALRGVKKAVTDAQNIALDKLRTDNEWQPKGPVLAETMLADLIGLWAESYSAGHQASEQMTGMKLRRKTTPTSNAADEFGELLASAVSEALASAGEDQRDRQSATSRVFRAWRTDEAERRIRELALVGFHRGVLESVGSNGSLTWVSAGTPCSACREAANDPASNPPPIHAGCECTLAIVFE